MAQATGIHPIAFAPEGAADNNAILNALWIFAGAPPAIESIIKGEADAAELAEMLKARGVS